MQQGALHWLQEHSEWLGICAESTPPPAAQNVFRAWISALKSSTKQSALQNMWADAASSNIHSYDVSPVGSALRVVMCFIAVYIGSILWLKSVCWSFNTTEEEQKERKTFTEVNLSTNLRHLFGSFHSLTVGLSANLRIIIQNKINMMSRDFQHLLSCDQVTFRFFSKDLTWFVWEEVSVWTDSIYLFDLF